MAEKRTKQGFFPLSTTPSGEGGPRQFINTGWREIGQCAAFGPGPDVFNRIELWGVSWEECAVQSGVTLQKGIGLLGAVGIPSVPDQEQGTPQLTQELAEKINGQGGIKVPVPMDAKEKGAHCGVQDRLPEQR